MTPLAVDPQVLDGAGAAVISAGEGLGSVISTLTTALSGCDGMAGDDPAGAAFGHSYNNSASKLLDAMTTTRNGLCRLGDGVRVSAHNYSAAEAMSNVSGHSQPLPTPHQNSSISASSAPSAVGNGVAAPAGWGWVSKYIGMIWPNGDSAKLRAAAAAWSSAGTQFDVDEIVGAVGPMGSIGAQQIPEGPAIAAAFATANRSAAGILQQCATIAAQLTSLASKIDTVHAAILDLLSRICNPLTGIKEVWEFLTADDDEDEIRRIASDIRVIVNQFTAEVEALRQEIAKTLSEAATILSTMARYAEKEWDHFLHDTDVGRALDHAGQICKGVFTEAEGFAKSFWTLSPVRVVVDPNGFWHSVSGTVDKLESLTGVEGEQRFKDAWKELGKDTVHWDEWSTNPFQATGESVFDLATLAIPGGALTELPKLGHLAADAAERSEELHSPTPLREPAPPQANPAPRSEQPRGGQPAPAPKTQQPMPPYGLTESKTPADPKSAAGAGPKPVVQRVQPESGQHGASATDPHARGGELQQDGVTPSAPLQPSGVVATATPAHEGVRAPNEHTPHTSEDGSSGEHHGGSFVGPYRLPAPELVTPPPDGAFFWSGRTSEGVGIGPQSAGGDGSANLFAAEQSGTTLEGLLERNGVKPPSFDFTDIASEEWWSKVSGMYAENARGEVHAVIGSNLRPGSAWETVELPRLKDNPNVIKIVVIDPETGLQKAIFDRGGQ
jgi:hypothetical protein